MLYLISYVMFLLSHKFCSTWSTTHRVGVGNYLFAVILSTFITVPFSCLLEPNIKAWLRIFSRNGVTIWGNSLQIITISSSIGTWPGAFSSALNWERLSQIRPFSCTLGVTFGYMAGLVISPLWIHCNKKQLTYKNN